MRSLAADPCLVHILVECCRTMPRLPDGGGAVLSIVDVAVLRYSWYAMSGEWRRKRGNSSVERAPRGPNLSGQFTSVRAWGGRVGAEDSPGQGIMRDQVLVDGPGSFFRSPVSPPAVPALSCPRLWPPSCYTLVLLSTEVPLPSRCP